MTTHSATKSQAVDDVLDLVDGYIADVLSGSRIVGRLERLAVERHVGDLRAVESGARADWSFDVKAGCRFLEFALRYVRYPKGPKARQRLRICKQTAWVAFVFLSVFAWQRWHPDQERWVRRFSVFYMSVGRGNAKTFWAAIVALYMLGWAGEASSEVYSAATKRDQAKICWHMANKIRKLDPYLRKTIKAIPSTSTMHTDEDDIFTARSRDKDDGDGDAPFCSLVDELHQHKDRGAWDTQESGMSKRTEPLMGGFTTAGSKCSGLWWDLDHDGQRMLEGAIVDDQTFAFIARLDDGDDWEDESVWQKANPSLGVVVDIEKIRNNVKKAKNNPANLNELKRKHFNVPAVGTTAWLPVQKWEDCALPPDEYAAMLASVKGKACFASADISAVSDFTAAALCWEVDGGYLLSQRLWIPKETVSERVIQDKVPVNVWIEQGWVHTTDGEIIDQDAVKMWVVNAAEQHWLDRCAVDPYNSWKLMSELQQLGVTVFQHRQGYVSMSPPMKETQKLILRGAAGETPRLYHDGNPAMRWMFLNASVSMDPAGNIKPDKDKSSDRIDGIVAAIMAIGQAVAAEEAPKPAFWSVANG